jgi:hypothetical protein
VARDSLKTQVSFLLDQKRKLEQKTDKIERESAKRVAELEAKIVDLTNQNDTMKTKLANTTAKLKSLKQTYAKCADQRSIKVDKRRKNQLLSSSFCTQKRGAVSAIVKEEDAATPALKKQRLDSVVTLTKIDLDPFELAQQIKFQLNRLGLSAKHVAEKLKLSYGYVSNILAHPAPWAELTEVMKNHYRNMHAWLVEHETKERENPISSRNLVFNEWLNTREEAREILTLLDMNDISHAFFANQKLNLNICNFEELVADPLPWESMSDEQKKTFTLIHMWRNAKPDELEELKRYCERHVRSRFRRRRR